MNPVQVFEGTAYRVTGDPAGLPVVVLVHGVGLDQDLWLPWLPVLGPRYCVVTLDLLGHGRSHNPPGDRSVLDFVEQVMALVDHLDVDRFALVGFSLGAIISQACASLHDRCLTHLVLLHSVFQRTEEQCQAVRERYRITRDQGPMATVELAIERWFSEEYRQDHPEQMERIRDVFARHTDDGYLKAYYLFSYAESEMRNYPVDDVGCPALVVTGSDDVGSTPAMSEALARVLPDAELIINPGHRHMGPAEHATTVANQVLSFLIK